MKMREGLITIVPNTLKKIGEDPFITARSDLSSKENTDFYKYSLKEIMWRMHLLYLHQILVQD
jgi:hypothetical protein